MLKNKIMLITGASQGLGRTIALNSAKYGATIIFTYSKNKEKAQSTLEELNKISTNNHMSFQVNCYSLEENLNLARVIKEKYSRLDILINNAGISEFLPLALIDEEDWDKLSNINLKGVFATTKAMLPFMVRQKSGNILNMSSLAGVRILAAPVHYCATKAGIKGFTESLSKELGRYNIQVNCLAPGILDGGVASGIPENKLNSFIAQVALGRIGTFEEVAEFSSFLVSDLNSYMSGHTIIMDGGL